MRPPNGSLPAPAGASAILSTVLAVSVGGCAVEIDHTELVTAEAAAGDPDYLRTPAGLYHRSCIHDLGAGAAVDRDDVVTRPDGTRFRLPACDYPHFPRAGTAAGDQDPQGVQDPEVNGWVVAGWQQAPTWIKSMHATWSVPPRPSNDDSSLVYFFPGLEPASGTRIIQPVLQYGDNGAFGGNYWTIASWSCGNTCPHSAPIRVSAGDTIEGRMTGSNCDSGHCDWNIRTAQGGAATSLTSNNDHPYIFAAAALEAYDVHSCSEYPDARSLTFSSISMKKGDGSTFNGNWSIRRFDASPRCGRDGSSTGPGNVTLRWDN